MIPYSIKLLKPRDLSNDPLTRNLGRQNSKCESFQSHNVLWIFPAKLGTRGIFIETSVKHVCKPLVIEFVTFVINPLLFLLKSKEEQIRIGPWHSAR